MNNELSNFSFAPEILHVLESKGITTLTEIQQKALPLLMEHKGDFVGRSATGTGKTYTFGIPLVSRVRKDEGNIQALVLVPTRELSQQVTAELQDLGGQYENLKVRSIHGGASLKSQINEVSNGVQIIVATPGRLVDLINRKVVHLSALDYLVFDEADEMMTEGFKDDIDFILRKITSNVNTWLFSATLPNQVNKIVHNYLKNNLEKVLLGEVTSTNKGIKHLGIKLEPEQKMDVLWYYLNFYGGQKGIIFCRTKSGVQKLYKQLSAQKFKCGAIHGNLKQGLRDKVMTQFRENQIDLLIATDVAARGVDVDDIEFVFQYHIPDTTDAYTHRSGRTARIGKSGTSLTFIFPEEQEQMNFLNDTLDLDIEYLSLPTKKDKAYNKAMIEAKKIANQKPNAKLSEIQLANFKAQLSHLSDDEMYPKLLSFLMEL